jgi:hypothetical protein
MEQVSLLPFARPTNSLRPVCQHFSQIAFSLLQSGNIDFDPSEFLSCEFKDSLARGTTSVTGFQDFGEF